MSAAGFYGSPLVEKLFKPLEAMLRSDASTASLASPDCAVFWDFGCLHQRSATLWQYVQTDDRSDEQIALFAKGRAASAVWFGHAHSLVLVQTRVPHGMAPAADRHNASAHSGWLYVEWLLGTLRKPPYLRVDLGRFNAKAAFGSDVSRAMQASLFPRAPAQPPPSVEAVEVALERMRFACEDDRAVVSEMYRRAVRAAGALSRA